ncbi:MAG: hypothetical protein RI907_610 [Pseudomonadota bacterium]
MSDDDRQTDWSVVPVALAFGLGLGAVGWWLTKDEPPDPLPAEVKRMDLEPPAAKAPVPVQPPTAASASAQVVNAAAVSAVPAVQAPVAAAAYDPIDAEFGAPLSALGTARPPFMNANEWGAVQRVVQGGEQTDEAMLDLVNGVRYRRLISKWQALPQGAAGMASPRARVARLLLDDMHARLASSTLDVAEARRMVPELLADAMPNPVERQMAAQALADMINQAQADVRSAAPATAPTGIPTR